MSRIVLILILLNLPITSFGQIKFDKLYGLYSEGKDKLLSKDSDGEYYECYGDSNYKYFISKDWKIYKLFENNKLMVEGGIRHKSDYFEKSGPWIEYYKNGNKRAEGWYYDNAPIGLWKQYYESGGLKELYNLIKIYSDSLANICLGGTYQMFYENGQIRINGNFMVKPGLDTIGIVNPEPPYQEIKTEMILPKEFRYGNWYFYAEDGKLVDMIDYGRE